jgi:1-acyl-sn-glycerol-3-phosphate acyltransferase
MSDIKVPRRIVIRSVLKSLISFALHTFSDFEVIGQENIPEKGPIIFTGNHFCFTDTIAMLHVAPPSIEMFSGANAAFAPFWATIFPRLWGVLYVYRGTGSRQAIRDAESVLNQGGFFGIFPEGGAWAEMIRPARPGAAYLASRTDARILPIGFTGFNTVLPIRFRNQSKVTIRIGKPYGPLKVTGRGKKRREQLDEIGERIMKEIAMLVPDHVRGKFSSDPAVRERALEAAVYPWEDATEHEV